MGAAYGFQFPNEGPLLPGDFSGGEATVKRKLQKLGFEVVVVPSSPVETPIVLVENEVTAGGRYDDWKDVTGERYHFPNKYRKVILQGRPFIYYRGIRRQGGKRGQAEYFGVGRIGSIYLDPEVALESSKRNQNGMRRLMIIAPSQRQFRQNKMGCFWRESQRTSGCWSS